MLDFRDSAGLKVILTELPLSMPPVEELEAFSILQVTYVLSEVSRVSVLEVEAVISPDTVKEIPCSLKDSGMSPVIPRIEIPSVEPPSKSPV